MTNLAAFTILAACLVAVTQYGPGLVRVALWAPVQHGLIDSAEASQ